MIKWTDHIELGAVITLTLFAKWLMTEEPPEPDEPKLSRKMKNRRTFGGIIAGAVCAFYGPSILIGLFDVLSEDVKIPLVIVMAITGEHFFRALITKMPDWIEAFVQARIGRTK